MMASDSVLRQDLGADVAAKLVREVDQAVVHPGRDRDPGQARIDARRQLGDRRAVGHVTDSIRKDDARHLLLSSANGSGAKMG
jgi:hypothetical protein